MILRPVRPASPFGPPMTNRPVGLTKTRVRSSQSERRNDVVDDPLANLAANDLERNVRIVLGRDDDRVDPNGPVALVLDGNLRLAVGPQVRDVAVLAGRGEHAAQVVRQRDRQRHQRVGLAARVAEHHALVAGADQLVRVVAPPPFASSERSTPIAMSGDCSSIETLTPQVSASKPTFERV